MTAVLSSVVPALAAAPKAHIPESMLRGGWCASNAESEEEEFSLDIEDGTHVFRSWLHHRPASDGTWQLAGRTLTITAGSDKRTTVYTILSLTRKRLVLRNEDERRREVYLRIGMGHCFEVEYPHDKD